MRDPDITITVNRDSVAAGDDCESHEAVLSIPSGSNVLELVEAARRACRLARISGGQATWLIDAGARGQCIGVAAQQWPTPKLLNSMDTTVAELFEGKTPFLYFRYWCQTDPDAVFGALRSNAPLPARR